MNLQNFIQILFMPKHFFTAYLVLQDGSKAVVPRGQHAVASSSGTSGERRIIAPKGTKKEITCLDLYIL